MPIASPASTKVTIVQGAFLPVPPVAGGAVEKLWGELSTEFARRGLSVTHISRSWPGLDQEAPAHGVLHRRLRGYDYPRSGLVAKLMDLSYSLRCLFNLPPSDVIVTNTFFLPLLLSMLPRRGVVYVSVHRYPQGQMKLYGAVDRLQCVSTAVADAVCSQAPKVAHLVKVVPNYVSTVLGDREYDEGWAARRNEVLFVGRVHPEKGLDLLLDGFASIPEAERSRWRVTVVGPHAVQKGGGGEDYLAGLKTLASRLGIEVEWVGAVYDADLLARHYREASVFVYPSTAAQGEAFPLAPLEAMAQGCPVVTSDLKCFEDYIQADTNGRMFALAKEPAAALGKVIRELIAQPATRHALGNAGLATARRFTLGRIADSFIEDFEALKTP